MPIEQLFKNIEGNSFLMERVREMAGEGVSPSRPELMEYYRSFLLGALREAESVSVGMDEGRRRVLLDQMAMNSALAADVKRAMDAAKTIDRYAIPEAQCVHLIKGTYVQWLFAELEEAIKVSVTLGVDEKTETAAREEVKAGFADLNKAIETGNAVQLMLERSKVDKTALKKEVREFLDGGKFSVFGTLRGISGKVRGTVTADLIQVLRNEMARLDREIQYLDGLEQYPMDYRRGWHSKLAQRKEIALGYCLLLRERQIDKDSTDSSLKGLTTKANKDFEALDKKFVEQNKQFIKGIEDIAGAIKQHEKWIEDGVARLSGLKKSIEATAARVFHEDELIDDVNTSLKRAQNRVAKLTQKEVEVTKHRDEASALAASMKDWKYAPYGLEAEAKKKSSLAQNKLLEISRKKKDTENKADALQNDLDAHKEARRKWQAQLDSLSSRIPLLATELCLLGTRYDTIHACVERVGQDQRAAALERKQIEQELEWLRKFKVIDRSLRVYATLSNVSFKLLLAIGKLVSGAHCGPIGPITINALGFAGLIQKAISAEGVMAVLPITTSAVGIAASNTVLSRIRAYDTGSFKFSLVLGVSGGIAVHGSCTELTGGLALVYNAGFNVQDDRRFRTVCTLTVEAVGEMNISELLKTELKAVIIKDTTTMVFQDVYHWAAWLGQRWANIAAMVQGCKFFDITDKWGMPSEMQRKHMLEVAAISMANHPRYEMLKDTMKYMNAPITRMHSSDLAAELEGKVTALGVAGLGGMISRQEDPIYYRQFTSTDKGGTGKPTVIEKYKKGKQRFGNATFETPVAGFSVAYDYSNIKEHANVDNEGEYHGLTFALGGTDEKAGFSHVSDGGEGVRVTRWVKDYLEPLADKAQHLSSEVGKLFQSVTESSRLKYFEEISGTLSLCNMEMVFQRVELKNKKSEICLLYIRPIVKKAFDARAKFETGVPGLLIDLGIGANLQRTYNERLGTNTFGYVQTVFNGLMNISDFDTKKEDNPRPEEAWGTTLWKGFVEQHDANLLQMLKNVARDNHGDPKRWITKEVLDTAVGKRFAENLRKDYAGRIQSMTKLDESLKTKLKDYLDGYRKSEEFKHKAGEGWVPQNADFKFSFSIIELSREIHRSRTQIYKLDKALKSIGPRRGVKEIMEENYRKELVAHQRDHWVRDEDAAYCTRCLVAFSMTTRRHHCRECGQIFCSKCLPHEIPLPHRGFETPQKVCEACFQKVKAREHGARAKPMKELRITESTESFYSPGAESKGAAGQAHGAIEDLGEWIIIEPAGEPLEEWTLLTQSPVEEPKAQEKPPEIKGSKAGPQGMGLWAAGHSGKQSQRVDLLAKGHASPKKPEQSPVVEPIPPPASPAASSPPPASPAATSSSGVAPEHDTRFVAIDVVGDGNCLFRSISVALTGREDSHADLRRSAVALMRCAEQGVMNALEREASSDMARSDVVAIMQNRSQAFGSYLKHMERDGTWGGSPELRCLAMLLRRMIIVHVQGQAHLIQAGEETDGRFTPLPGVDPIHLLYEGKSHYKCFRPIAAHLPPQQDVYPHLIGYHGTSAYYRDSIRAGLKAKTERVWGEGEELGPGFYTTKDYGTSRTYGEGTSQKLGLRGIPNTAVDVWEVRSMIPLAMMQGQPIGREHMWRSGIEMSEWMDQNHYFYNADELQGGEILQYKFNPWAFGFLKVTLLS
jgi:hypothetical protein